MNAMLDREQQSARKGRLETMAPEACTCVQAYRSAIKAQYPSSFSRPKFLHASNAMIFLSFYSR